jgi:hypothetical protein
MTQEEKTLLQLDDRMIGLLDTALEKGRHAQVTWRGRIQQPINYAAANSSWAQLPEPIKNQFILQTGLGEREYLDMARVKADPPTTRGGADLSGDAWAAFGTTAILRNQVIRDFLMDIFQDFDKFTVVTKSLMRKNLNNAMRSPFWDGSEEHLAAMVARAHNGGEWRRSLRSLTGNRPGEDSGGYVKSFLGRLAGRGDLYSLRCVDSFGSRTLEPGRNGRGIGGLEMTALVL